MAKADKMKFPEFEKPLRFKDLALGEIFRFVDWDAVLVKSKGARQGRIGYTILQATLPEEVGLVHLVDDMNPTAFDYKLVLRPKA